MNFLFKTDEKNQKGGKFETMNEKGISPVP